MRKRSNWLVWRKEEIDAGVGSWAILRGRIELSLSRLQRATGGSLLVEEAEGRSWWPAEETEKVIIGWSDRDGIQG